MKAIVSLGAVGLALLVALAFLYSRMNAEASGPDQGAYRGSEPPARIVMPDFVLQDYEGKQVTSDSLLGRVVLLTFLDAQCKESCPVIAAQVAQTFGRMDSGAPGAMDDIVTTVTARTVYVDVSC